MAITIKTAEEITIMREGGQRLAAILHEVVSAVRPGVSALYLNKLAERLMREAGGVPSFKGYRPRGERTPYPAALCVSVNDEVVHAIPQAKTILREGDIVAIDIGMWWPSVPTENKNGQKNNAAKKTLCTDMAVTIGVGKIDAEAERLLSGTRVALDAGIAAVRAGVRVGDISAAIGRSLKESRLAIVRDLAGHGVGYELHEDPFIPNWGSSGTGPRLEVGIVIALEPIANLGTPDIVLQKDNWTFKTADGLRSAHFEHTLAVMENGAEVLTAL
ncbi:MAG: M24 family metallopeptidase [bacterium]|nr:M24 family metallopeptidase [bacterium]